MESTAQPVEQPQIEEKQENQAQDDGSIVTTDSDGNTIRIPKKWDYDNAFVYETEELRKIFQDVDPGNTALTEEMKKYYPVESWLQFGKSKPVRLLFYPLKESGPWDYTEEEMNNVKIFKDACKNKDREVPHCDAEIIRAHYCRKHDTEKALALIDETNTFYSREFPLKVNDQVLHIIQQGAVYIAGRDKCMRPVLVADFGILNNMKPYPDVKDTITAAMLCCFYARKYMMCEGRIEN